MHYDIIATIYILRNFLAFRAAKRQITDNGSFVGQGQ